MTWEKVAKIFAKSNPTDKQLLDQIEHLHKNCLYKGDPLLQYLFNTIAQLNTRVARLENPEEFDFIGEIEDEND